MSLSVAKTFDSWLVVMLLRDANERRSCLSWAVNPSMRWPSLPGKLVYLLSIGSSQQACKSCRAGLVGSENGDRTDDMDATDFCKPSVFPTDAEDCSPSCSPSSLQSWLLVASVTTGPCLLLELGERGAVDPRMSAMSLIEAVSPLFACVPFVELRSSQELASCSVSSTPVWLARAGDSIRECRYEVVIFCTDDSVELTPRAVWVPVHSLRSSSVISQSSGRRLICGISTASCDMQPEEPSDVVAVFPESDSIAWFDDDFNESIFSRLVGFGARLRGEGMDACRSESLRSGRGGWL
mmetsp:Transcript_9037/g.14502  ORF Transcript_9037/g.14502 Transcript_9037/m.14502 type:complete len:296 (-) Transcript_9037:3532-4419(-)